MGQGQISWTICVLECSWSQHEAPDAKQSKEVLVESIVMIGSVVPSNKGVSSPLDATALYESSAQLTDRSLCQQHLNGTSFKEFFVCHCEGQWTFVPETTFTDCGEMRPVRFVFQLIMSSLITLTTLCRIKRSHGSSCGCARMHPVFCRAHGGSDDTGSNTLFVPCTRILLTVTSSGNHGMGECRLSCITDEAQRQWQLPESGDQLSMSGRLLAANGTLQPGMIGEALVNDNDNNTLR